MTVLNSRKKVVAVWFFCTTVFAAAVGVTVWYASHLQNKSQAQAENTSEETNASLPPALPDDVESLSVLLLGYGGAGHQGGYLTDVIQVVHVDFSRQKTHLISLPRDLFVPLPNGTAAKINTAFTLGKSSNRLESGAVVAQRMVEQVLGIPIDNVIAVDFDGFERTIGGWVGGIEVSVSETLDDPWYPIKGRELDPCSKTPEEVATLSRQYTGFELERQFECRYERVFFPAGTHRMQGGEALKFVRSRHGSTAGDFSRSKRQHEVLEAILQKMITLKALESAPEFFAEAKKHVYTDFVLADIEKLTPLLRVGLNFEHQSIVLGTDTVFTTAKSSTGQFILQPKAGPANWGQVHQHLKELLEKND